MKPVIQLKLGQQLTMTPQLRQAIELLQLSSIDLQQTIQATVEINPLLELCEAENGTDESEAPSPLSPEETREQDSLAGEEGSWESLLYPERYLRARTLSQDGKSDVDVIAQREKELSLKDHLLWQLELAPLSPRDHAIANFIIDAINDEGYLTIPLDELQKTINQQAITELEDPLEVKELEIVLHHIQQFDPVGVGARDLKECLLLQLKQFSPNMSDLPDMQYLITYYLPLLAKRQYPQIKSKMKISEQRLKGLLKKLKYLDPKPGLRILPKKAEYIIPDVIVQKINGVWAVHLNAEFSPHVRIHPHYAALVRRADNSRDNLFLKTQLTEARWFLKSLKNRNDTLLRVAKCIVDKQQAFLEKGAEVMQPLILRDIASELDLHESTISRITNKKFLFTPRGTFELKHFFSSHLHKVSGEECSSTAIRALIKKFILQESPAKPLSDDAIAKLLAKKGIPIARRTVTKYRETLSILASHHRKCFNEKD